MKNFRDQEIEKLLYRIRGATIAQRRDLVRLLTFTVGNVDDDALTVLVDDIVAVCMKHWKQRSDDSSEAV